MKDPSGTKQELAEEICVLKQRIRELEKADAECKRMNDVLRESEGRFRALVGQAAVGFAEIVMETGPFITVNQRLCGVIGRTEEELLATAFPAIAHPEDLHLHKEKTAQRQRA